MTTVPQMTFNSLPPHIQRAMYEQARRDGRRFDAATETMALESELVAREEELYRKRFEENTWMKAFPTTFDGPGHRKVSFRHMEEYGTPKWGTEEGPVPLVDHKRVETETKVDVLWLGYHYNWHELQYSTRQNMNLDLENGETCKRQIDTKIDEVAYLGDTTVKKTGLLSNTSALTEYTVLADGTGSSKTWASKSGTQIHRDVTALLAAVRDNSIFRATALLLPPAQEEMLMAATFEDGSSVMANLMQVRNDLRIIGSQRLKNAISTDEVMVAFPFNKEVLNFKVPVPFMQLPGFWNGYQYDVPCYADVAGMELKHPKAIVFGKGI